MDVKSRLVRRVQRELESMVSKAEGISEYDARRPLVPSGSNILGILQHTSAVVLGYMTECFGQDAGWELPFFAPGAEDGADMWVAVDVPREHVLGLGRHTVRRVGDIGELLNLDSPGRVPWWKPENADVTFGELLVHVLAETSRHAGHVDILRELVDGSIGAFPGDPNVPALQDDDWVSHRARIEAIARQFPATLDNV